MSARIACTAIIKRIQMGRVNKAGTAFVGNPVDVTSDCLKAVIDKIGAGNTEIITSDGVPVFEIEVRRIAAKAES